MPDTYIEECTISRTLVKIYTVNGFQMVGKIVEHNTEGVVVLCGKYKKFVFKHAISTIEPFCENGK